MSGRERMKEEARERIKEMRYRDREDKDDSWPGTSCIWQGDSWSHNENAGRDQDQCVRGLHPSKDSHCGKQASMITGKYVAILQPRWEHFHIFVALTKGMASML